MNHGLHVGGGKGFGVVGSLNLGLGGESSINLPSSVEILARNLSSKADSFLQHLVGKLFALRHNHVGSGSLSIGPG